MKRLATIPERDSFALVHAPVGRDSEIAASLLSEAGIRSQPTADLPSFISGLSDNVALAVITDEALRSADVRPLARWIEAQPSWSDLPFIVLTQRGGGPERNPAAFRLSEVLGNASFVERPFHATTFISVARAAMRGRRRQYEARLRIEALDEGERRLYTAIAAGRLGTWELNLETKELTTSAMCKAIFGRQPDDRFTYDDLVASTHPDDRQRMQDALRETIGTGIDYAIEYRTTWPDSSVHWAEVRAQLYRDSKGEAVRLIGVSADVTDRRLAQELQKRQNEILEDRVIERTAELWEAHTTMLAEVAQRQRAEEQLRQSQKMEAIGQLTGGIAHDFNNLLMAVLGNLELVQKHLGHDPKAQRLIDGALQGARRGAALTQRLLAFARRQDLQVGPIDMGKLVVDMEELLQRSVGSSLSIETSIADGLPLASADANQVELALLNLVVNARDAMADGGVVRLELKEAAQDVDDDELSAGRYVVLSVIDTGHGMDAETLKKAIEPFFSTKELGKGTGLGLSMIHGLALQLKGTLKMASSPGEGTTASLWIPVATETIAVTRDMQKKRESIPPKSGPKRVLLVDDDILIAMSSADMLADLGHEVVEAHSGPEALDILNSGTSFDLLITDYSMPGMTGAELARKARSTRPELPILLATGYAELPAGQEMKVARLGKPYSQEQLAAEIAKMFIASQ